MRWNVSRLPGPLVDRLLMLFLVWSSSGSPPHWRTKIEEYKYLGMDVNLSDVITNLQENLNT